MSHPLRFGVLGVADIAVRKVIPALQAVSGVEVTAIGSRDIRKAERAAAGAGIEIALGSYEKVIAHPRVDAVYIPLPNSLHAEWAIAAARAGKHVLCEKPLAMSEAEGEQIAEAAEEHGVMIMEAFMYRLHPQWGRVRDLLSAGAIGRVRSVMSWFSYHNDDPDDIRNIPALGGGATRDIGCYGINAARLVFGGDPVSVKAVLEVSDRFGTDTLASILLEFPDGHASITCSTLAASGQWVRIIGERGTIHVPAPFSVEPDQEAEIRLSSDGRNERISVPPADHFVIQAEGFARAVEGAPRPVPLGNSLGNLRVMDQVFESARG